MNYTIKFEDPLDRYDREDEKEKQFVTETWGNFIDQHGLGHLKAKNLNELFLLLMDDYAEHCSDAADDAGNYGPGFKGVLA